MERRYFLCALVCSGEIVRLPGEYLFEDIHLPDWQNILNIHPGSDIQRLAEHYREFRSGKGPGTLLRRSGKFSEAIARDFERGLVVRVDGWLYSRTELYLCALKVGLLNQVMES